MAFKHFVIIFLVSVQHAMPYILPRHNYEDSDGLERALQLLERKRLNGDNDDNSPLPETLADIEENKLQKIIQEILEEQDNPDELGLENDELSPLGNDEDYSDEDGILSGLRKRGGPRFAHRKPSLLSQLLEEENENVPMRFSHRKPRIDKRYLNEWNDESDYYNYDKRFAHRKPYTQNYYRQKYRPRKRDTFDMQRDEDELEFEKKYSHRKPYRYNVKPKPRLYKRDLQDLTSEEDTSDIEEEKKWAHRKPFRKINLVHPNKRDMGDYDMDEIDDFDKRYSHRKPFRKQSYRNYKRDYDDLEGLFEEDKRFSHRKPSKFRYISKSQGRPKKFYDDNSDESEGSGNPAGESYKNWMIQNYLQSLPSQTTGSENGADKTTEAGEFSKDADSNNSNTQQKSETLDSNKEATLANQQSKTEIGSMKSKMRTMEDAVLRDAMAMIEDAKARGYSTENDPNAQREFAHLATAYKLDKLRQSMADDNQLKKN